MIFLNIQPYEFVVHFYHIKFFNKVEVRENLITPDRRHCIFNLPGAMIIITYPTKITNYTFIYRYYRQHIIRRYDRLCLAAQLPNINEQKKKSVNMCLIKIEIRML